MHQRGISAITSESFPFKLLALKASHDNHLRVNEEGNCSESVLESREPGGEQFQDTGIIFLFSTYMHPALDDIFSCVPRK